MLRSKLAFLIHVTCIIQMLRDVSHSRTPAFPLYLAEWRQLCASGQEQGSFSHLCCTGAPDPHSLLPSGEVAANRTERGCFSGRAICKQHLQDAFGTAAHSQHWKALECQASRGPFNCQIVHVSKQSLPSYCRHRVPAPANSSCPQKQGLGDGGTEATNFLGAELSPLSLTLQSWASSWLCCCWRKQRGNPTYWWDAIATPHRFWLRYSITSSQRCLG